MNRTRRFVFTLALVGLAACSQDTAVPTVPEAIPTAQLARQQSQQTPRISQRAAKAPPFVRKAAELIAVVGEGGETAVHFVDGSPIATFRVGPETLRGATIAGGPAGDTVVITLSTVDGSRFLVELQPAGLRFNPDAPAELVFHYRHAANSRWFPSHSIWRQESAGLPWEHLGGTTDAEHRTITVSIDGFTRYAMSH